MVGFIFSECVSKGKVVISPQKVKRIFDAYDVNKESKLEDKSVYLLFSHLNYPKKEYQGLYDRFKNDKGEFTLFEFYNILHDFAEEHRHV